MNKKVLTLSTLVLLSFGSGFLMSKTSYAESSAYLVNGTVEFDGEYKQVVVDPENPDQTVDPGTSPKTDGNLRIDFVPQLHFGSNKISTEDKIYPVHGQLFHGDTEARGNFIQVSDFRPNAAGWTLQVRQETQFKNNNTLFNELDGAMLSFDKSWVNTTGDLNKAPEVSKEIIRIDNIGETYQLAKANNDHVKGTWSIIFGASDSNPSGKKSTLKPKVDSQGNPVLDPNFENKQIVENSAVTLSIPGVTKVDPVSYKTVLTWILAELP
ncbi:WxL domain-containing protein [Candidatus Enterococcus ikei]|uniref:WxL domain-containing protein n=1 Tax=Candidatus Enterococcus ikei TaxID=2815326 RepID=A0ABS3GY25_9ENTE|nr:WxL domain-containing protein [Enterococcus sp. DIV0869a]MBO0439874.1 WxL domain-containing protein [Enterococcus sp. DIV0869a]